MAAVSTGCGAATGWARGAAAAVCVRWADAICVVPRFMAMARG